MAVDNLQWVAVTALDKSHEISLRFTSELFVEDFGRLSRASVARKLRKLADRIEGKETTVAEDDSGVFKPRLAEVGTNGWAGEVSPCASRPRPKI